MNLSNYILTLRKKTTRVMTLADYIPVSSIIKTSEIHLIKKLPLPQEIISIILSYYGTYISPTDQKPRLVQFWKRTGNEAKILYEWHSSCFFLLQDNMGKTKAGTWMNILKDDLMDLLSALDEMVNEYYPWVMDSIRTGYIFIGASYERDQIQQYYKDTTYKYTFKYGKYTHTLTSCDKKYILTFFERCKTYLDYLERFRIDEMDIYFPINSTTKKTKNKLEQIIRKTKKKCDKTYEQIKNITVKERIK